MNPAGWARNPSEFYRQVDTAPGLNKRLKTFAREYLSYRANSKYGLNILDVGCGRHAVLSRFVVEGDRYVGLDIAQIDSAVSIDRFELIDLNVESAVNRLGQDKFDIIFCGEVVEHLFSPDVLLQDLHVLLATDGIVILSTPNLGYWVNRILLLLGISPLFLENSSRRKMGRRFRLLGQGNTTEGHVRLFTYRALREFVASAGFVTKKITAVPVWANGIDDLVSRLAPSLAPDLVFIIKKGSPAE